MHCDSVSMRCEQDSGAPAACPTMGPGIGAGHISSVRYVLGCAPLCGRCVFVPGPSRDGHGCRHIQDSVVVHTCVCMCCVCVSAKRQQAALCTPTWRLSCVGYTPSLGVGAIAVCGRLVLSACGSTEGTGTTNSEVILRWFTCLPGPGCVGASAVCCVCACEVESSGCAFWVLCCV